MSIELTTDGPIATVTINRPEKKNAMLLAMRDALADVCERINDTPQIRADEALRLGLVHKVVPDAALMDEALALARDYAAAPTIALGLAKRMFDVAPTLTLDEFMDLEGSMLPLSVQADDFKEGTQAFKDKRAAVFTGH